MQVKIASQVVRLDASQQGYVLAIGDRRYVAGQRARLTFSTAIVVLVHALVLWALIGTMPRIADLPNHDDDVIQAELYRPVPTPEPPVEPVPVVKAVTPQPQPPQPQPQPQLKSPEAPKAAVQSAPVPSPPTPVPAPPVPVPQTPRIDIKVAPRPQDDFSTTKLSAQQARTDVKLQNSTLQAQTIDPESKAANLKLKKKEEEQLDAKSSLAAAHAPDAGDLKLHETPVPSIQTVAAPSGLTPDGTHLATGASAPPSGGGSAAAASLAGAAAGGGKGKLSGGRGNLTQALQNDDFCLKAQRDGKPIPGDCHLKGMAQMAGVTAVLSPEMQREAAAHDFQQRYKTQPGNAAYWKRGNAPAPNDPHISDDDQAGAYTDPKAQRVFTGTDPDPKNSIHQQAH